MHFYDYKGFTIYPSPRLLLDSGAWTVSLTIRRGGKTKAIETAHCFSTKGEAAFHCIEFGKKVIDGVAGEWTVDELIICR